MAAREIILLRHAHARTASSGQADAGRSLSPEGEAEAEAAAAWLKEHSVAPSRVLYSSTARTRETYERVQGAFGATEAREDARIYDATPGTLINVLEENADAPVLMVVGHNPGLENLVALLTDGTSDSGRGMPPAAIAWLSVPADAAIEPGVARVRHFWWP